MLFRITLAVAIAAVLVSAAIAFAARPAKDSSFAWCTSKNVCPMNFDTNKKGRKIVNLSLYTDCATVPPMDGYWPNIKVRRRGKFSKQGSFEDVIGQTIEFEIKGRFKKKKKAVGTYLVERADCNDSEQKFVAKRRGPAQ